MLGFVLLLPVGLLYLASGLIVPLPWLLGLWAVGLALVVHAVVRRDRPAVVLATPFVALLLWVAVVSAGQALFDWSA